MLPDLCTNPPLLTADLAGIGGRIKSVPEDFEVEEIPAYPPSGSGDFLYLWVEKRGIGADYFTRQMARRLDIPVGEIGMAGLKDRRAVTRQMVSVPARVESRLSALEGDGLRLLKVDRHVNKLKPGHLHGNHFRILVRGSAAREGDIERLLHRLHGEGMPNFYGPQRFGRGGETLQLGLNLLRDEKPARRPSSFLRRLALSAAQAALFNHYLGKRMRDGLLYRVLPGDVMAKLPCGGLFLVEDVVREQQRFNAREIVSMGPIFGRKTFAAAGEAHEREIATLAECGIEPDCFRQFGKLLQGTRRHNLVYVKDLSAAICPDGVWLTFTLPSGSYATVLLREITKSELPNDDAD
jgi:tRNA pseudouridine13 synthase